MFLIPDEKCKAFCRALEHVNSRVKAADMAVVPIGDVTMVLKWGGMNRTDVPFLSDSGHAECQAFLQQVWAAERKRDEPMMTFELAWQRSKERWR